MSTKAQQVHERVEALVGSGVRKSDAFRQVADEVGQPFNSIRGAYYTHARTLGGSNPRQRGKRETTTEDAVESATAVLARAIETIDAEVTLAKTRADEAKGEYEHLRDNAGERKAAIQAKIDALSG